MKDLYLDVDIVRDASGELRANVDFSRYIGRVRDEFLRKIDAAILESVEPQLNALGWVKERTCRDQDENESLFVCSECGASCQLLVNEAHYCPNCGARVLSEEEQGHMVADAIRRLEKAVEE